MRVIAPSRRSAAVLSLLALSLALSGCGGDEAGAAGEEPAVVEPIEGTELSRIRLSEDAGRRLAIETAPVEEADPDEGALTVPYGAVLWDASGTAWVYVAREPLVFERAEVSVERIDDDLAILSDGPEPGTDVVSVGAAELWGTETGVGGDAH